MKLKLAEAPNLTWTYLGKVLLTAFLYYAGSRLGDFFVFTHASTQEQFQVFWAPSGIALGMMILLGPSIWPGILIGSLMRTFIIATMLGASPEVVTMLSVSLAVASGRALEALAGYALINKYFLGNKSFNNPDNMFRFIGITVIISTISSGVASFGINLADKNSLANFVIIFTRYYFNGLFGILLLTPFTLVVYEVVRSDAKRIKSICIQAAVIIIVSLIFFFYKPAIELNPLIIRTVYLTIVPMLIWVAFQYHLAVASIAAMAVCILMVYFVSQDVNPFVGDLSGGDLAVLLNLFFITSSFSMLLASAAANERKEQMRQIEASSHELTNSNTTLHGVIEELQSAKLKAEESDVLKASFLANISHEIRTPMNAIVGFSELLNRHNQPSKKSEEFTKLIRQRSKDLLNIVNDIIDISKIDSGQLVHMPTVGNIEHLLDQLSRDFSAELNHLHNKSIEVKTHNDLKGAENIVVADFVRLHQIFTNLLHNAMKFTEHGSIELGCRFRDQETLLFYVSDTGIGIDASQQEIIFKRFQQASAEIHQQYGGTGLGLTIIKGVLSLWNGEIWVESKPGEGSVFYFTMPYQPDLKLTLSIEQKSRD